MERISEYTLDWMDRMGWCDCRPPKDACEVCQAKRQAMRQQQAKLPKVFSGQAAKPRRLDWEP